MILFYRPLVVTFLCRRKNLRWEQRPQLLRGQVGRAGEVARTRGCTIQPARPASLRGAAVLCNVFLCVWFSKCSCLGCVSLTHQLLKRSSWSWEGEQMRHPRVPKHQMVLSQSSHSDRNRQKNKHKVTSKQLLNLLRHHISPSRISLNFFVIVAAKNVWFCGNFSKKNCNVAVSKPGSWSRLQPIPLIPK